MKEQLITFDTAKLAKEKGFGLGKDDYVQLPTVYELDGSLYNDGELEATVGQKYSNSPNHLGADTIDDFEGHVFNMDNSLDEFILAPTQSLLQKWLREEHGYQINNNMDSQNMYHCMIYRNRDVAGPFFSYSYEEALEKGLQESLKLIK